MWTPPLLMDVSVSPAGGVAWPRSKPAAPQQTGLPSEIRPQVWKGPALSDWSCASPGGELWP